MSGYHVHICDACGAEARTYNDRECNGLPSGWAVGQKGAYCDDCGAADAVLLAVWGGNRARSAVSDSQGVGRE